MKLVHQAIAKSVGLHAILLVGLAVSVEFPNTPKPTPDTPMQPLVQAVVIDSAIIDAQNARIEAQKQAAIRAQQQREEQARQQRLEQQRKQQAAERERQRKIAEKRKAEQEAKRKAEEERQARERQKKAEQERQRQLQQQREREEAERKARELAEQKRREEEARRAEQQRIEEQMRQEQLARQQQQRREFILTETERASAKIKAAIQNYLIGDNSMYGKVCTVRMRLASTGFVTNFSVVRGDTDLCTALKRAVDKQVKLPMSDDPDVNRQLRDITLTFSPTQ